MLNNGKDLNIIQTTNCEKVLPLSYGLHREAAWDSGKNTGFGFSKLGLKAGFINLLAVWLWTTYVF
jgi:hypothetical protein